MSTSKALRCLSALDEAAWGSDGQWHWPTRGLRSLALCNHSHLTQNKLREILTEASVTRIKICGDSVLRRFFFTLIAMLRGEGRGSYVPNPTHGTIPSSVAGPAWYDDLPVCDHAIKHFTQLTSIAACHTHRSRAPRSLP